MSKPQDSKLKPQLSLFDAVATGLDAILGAGIFTIIAPATGLAGPAVLVSFAIGLAILAVGVVIHFLRQRTHGKKSI